MHIAFFTHCYPAIFSNGGSEICWTILKSLKKKKYKVTLFVIAGSEEYAKCIKNYEKLKNLVNNVFIYKSERKDSLYNLLKKKPWQFFKPSPELLMPAFKLKKKVEAVIKKKQPNSIFVYDWHAAPCVIDINLNKILIVGDLLHFPYTIGLFNKGKLGKKVEFNFKNFCRILGTLWIIFHYKKFQIKLMNFFNDGGSFGFWDSKWLKNHGVKFSEYFKTPYYDTQKLHYKKKTIKFLKVNSKKKIKIMSGLGRLHATATSAGLYYLYKQLIPLMNHHIGNEKYEIHILGDGYLNKKTEGIKNYKNVFIRGYVDDLYNELETTEIFLLATPILLGYRARLINCAALSQCLVVHKSDTINMPELINKKNCMIGDSAEEIVLNLKKVIGNTKFRNKLKTNIRNMYEQNFIPSLAMERIFEKIDKR